MNRILGVAILCLATATCDVKGQNADAPLAFDLSNPGLFAGTDFGSFFQRLWINQDYGQMVTFTSKKSRRKFGDKQLQDYYRSMDFAYPLQLKSKSIHEDTIYLNYLTNILATSRIVKMPVVVERDTVMLIIESIGQRHLLFD
jgi:hypothetical protein